MQRVTVLLRWGERCLYCTFLLYYKLHSLTHTHALFFPITKHCSEDSSGFSIVPEDIFTCQLEQPGINLPTFQLVDNPLYLLSHSCLCVYLPVGEENCSSTLLQPNVMMNDCFPTRLHSVSLETEHLNTLASSPRKKGRENRKSLYLSLPKYKQAAR